MQYYNKKTPVGVGPGAMRTVERFDPVKQNKSVAMQTGVTGKGYARRQQGVVPRNFEFPKKANPVDTAVANQNQRK